MKKIFVTIATSALLLPLLAFGHGETGGEAKEGEEIVNKLNAKTVTCATLKNDDFEKVGEFYMHRMMGEGHDAMNTMMEQMMGKEGEEQMHATMGKRMSGCDTSATMGMMQGGGMMGNMMGGMMSGIGGGMMNRGWVGTPGTFGMMTGFSDWSWLGWLAAAACVLFWILVFVLLIGLVRWVWKKGSNS